MEQAVAGERFGWDAFWTVEHHFLPEYSHCSNPEVLYGAIAALTERMRLGYGVRLMPQPYNHPVRTAESVAVLDLISERPGRLRHRSVGRPGPSSRASASTRPRPGPCGRRPSSTWSAAGPTTSTSSPAATGRCPGAGSSPSRSRSPTRRIWGATTSEEGHRQVGELGLGLCSFAVGVSPEEVKAQGRHLPRRRWPACTEPLGAYVHDEAATFTMALCAADRPEALDLARESFEWYPKVGARQIASVVRMDGRAPARTSGTYSYAADMQADTTTTGSLDLLSLEYLIDANACVLGTPEECVEMCRRYEAAGIDLLLCLVNPYKIPHEAVMETIELMGTEVIPKFAP